MKKKLLLFLSICFVLHTTAQLVDPMSAEGSRLKKNRIDQKVTVKRMYVREVDEEGKVSKKGKLRSEDVFDSRGNCVKASVYAKDFTIINETDYDQKGRELKMISRNGEGQVRQKLIYEYGSNDSLVKINYYNPDGRLSSSKSFENSADKNSAISHAPGGGVSSRSENTYDSLEQSFTSRLLAPTGELKYENKYYLNTKKQILRWTVIDNIQNKRFTRKYTYDDRGNKTEEHTYSESGEAQEKIINTYNEKNLLIESVYFKPYDKLKQVFRYDYKYE